MSTRSPAISVALDNSDLAGAARDRWTLATLPRRFRVTASGERADVVVVAGDRTGWSDLATAAIRLGARAVVVSRPAVGNPAAVRALQEHSTVHGAVVAVDSPVLDPAWASVESQVRRSAEDGLLLSSIAAVAHPVARPGTITALRRGLIEQLALVRSAAGELGFVSARLCDGVAYAISARGSRAPITLAGTVSSIERPRLELDVMCSTELWQIRFEPGASAGGTRIARFDIAGGAVTPRTYESARRLLWSRLEAALADHRFMPYTLLDLAEELEFADRCFPGEGSP